MGSDIEGTFIFKNFVYSSIYGELPLQTWTQSKPAAMSEGAAAEASTYKKTTLMKELGKCVTAAQAARLDSLGIGIQDLVQLRDCNCQEGFLTALR